MILHSIILSHIVSEKIPTFKTYVFFGPASLQPFCPSRQLVQGKKRLFKHPLDLFLGTAHSIAQIERLKMSSSDHRFLRYIVVRQRENSYNLCGQLVMHGSNLLCR